jgi:nucleoside-diphosphate-sugar epimerase
MKVLITGSNGFLGSNLSKFFKSKSYDVNCMVHKNREHVEEFKIIEHDLLNEFINDEYFDIVVHTAAISSSKVCIKEPKRGLDNITQTFNILEFCKRNKIPKFIFFSSCEVYGKGGENSEDTQPESINMYGASKVACEHMCAAFNKSCDLHVVIFRLLNTWGENCQDDRFPTIIQNKFKNENVPHFKIKTRDRKRWLHVNEMCEKVYKVMQKFPSFEIFNLVGDENLTMVEFISQLGTNFTYEYMNESENGYCNDFNASGFKLYAYLE